jgi:hypothetical protein
MQLAQSNLKWTNYWLGHQKVLSFVYVCKIFTLNIEQRQGADFSEKNQTNSRLN